MRSGLGWVLVAVGAFAVMSACSSSKSEATADAGAEGGTVTSALTWHRDVRPIVEAKCANCHKAGAIAPFTLASFKEVFDRRDAIAAAVRGNLMPPWPPSAACNKYKEDRSLTQAERDAVLGWVAGGAPEGNAADYRAPTSVVHELSRVDYDLKIPQAYTPVESPDEYRCFVVDWPAATTKYVTGFGVTPGNPLIVHHVIAFVATPDLLATAEKLDADDAGPGYRCFGGPGIQKAPWIAAWAPGVRGSDMPEGTGIKIPQGSKVIVQIHYNLANATATADQTAVEFKVDDAVQKEAVLLRFANPSWVQSRTMNIPAGAKDTTHAFAADVGPALTALSGGALTPGEPFTVYSASLHMHTRGTKATIGVTRASGQTDCALGIDDWNFHWQGNYALQAPMVVNPGDKLSLECHFDNSGARQPLVEGHPIPVKDANWGETTEDEMCLGVLYATK